MIALRTFVLAGFLLAAVSVAGCFPHHRYHADPHHGAAFTTGGHGAHHRQPGYYGGYGGGARSHHRGYDPHDGYRRHGGHWIDPH